MFPCELQDIKETAKRLKKEAITAQGSVIINGKEHHGYYAALRSLWGVEK